MPSVAEQLRSARESRSLTVYQVSEATKIKTEHVRALDDGNYHVFSAPVYIRGFVRTYSTLLKLDVPAVMAELDAELSRTKEFSEPPSLLGRPRGPLDFLTFQLSKVPWGLVLPLVVIALLISGIVWGVQAWRHHQAQDPLAKLGPGAYQRPAGTRLPSSDTLPLPNPGPLPPAVPATPGPRR